jgi:NADPH:quinone reductase-like Zn-dependent oxidoreductase
VARTARAYRVLGPGHGALVEVELPEPGPDDVVVATRHTAISRGTELLVFRGGVPASQHGIMRAPFQSGEFPGPVTYGYLAVGTVEACSACTPTRPGSWCRPRRCPSCPRTCR